MTNEEAIKELEWIYQNGFDNDLAIVGTDRILDSIRIAIEVLEKQIPKKPFHSGLTYDCPSCLEEVGKITKSNKLRKTHRCVCGQAIDWSEVE